MGDVRGYIGAVAAAARVAAQQLVAEWIPDGKPAGKEWVGPNPVTGEGSERFSVNTHTGVWKDFGDDAVGGGDLVSLYAYLHSIGQLKAAQQIAPLVGVPPLESDGDHGRRRTAPRDDGRMELCWPAPVRPPPLDLVLVDRDRDPDELHPEGHTGWGTAEMWWRYLDTAGQILRVVARWRTDGGKEVRQLTCWRKGERVFWRRKGPQGVVPAMPLFGLSELAERPTAPVLVVEGEKDCGRGEGPGAVPGAHELLPEFVSVCSHNGAAAARKHDWTPLARRRVVVWPDCDGPGGRFVRDVCSSLEAIGVQSLQVVDMLEIDRAMRENCGRGWEEQGAGAADLTEAEVAAIDLPGILHGAPAYRRPDDTGIGIWPHLDGDGIHETCVRSIAVYLVNHGLVPDAMQGWRDARTWRLQAVSIKTLAQDYVFHARVGMQKPKELTKDYVQDCLEHMHRHAMQIRDQRLIARVVHPLDASDRELGLLQLGHFLEGLTGGRDQVTIQVIKHWIWVVKRRLTGKEVEHHIMPVISGPQGSGKTSAVRMLCSPLDELAIDADVSFLTDERKRPVLARAVIGRWDEMQGASKADAEALKHTITSDDFSFRPLATNQHVTQPIRTSWIGTTNKSVQSLIYDTTGARRFFEISSTEVCDWALMNEIDYLALWGCVHEDDPAPIKAVLDAVRLKQGDLTHRDPISLWLESETWLQIDLRSVDEVASVGYRRNGAEIADAIIYLIPAYDPAAGYSLEQVMQRYQSWRRRVGEPITSMRQFPQRLKESGWTETRKRTWKGFEGKRTYRWTMDPAVWAEHIDRQQESGSDDLVF